MISVLKLLHSDLCCFQFGLKVKNYIIFERFEEKNELFRNKKYFSTHTKIVCVTSFKK
jgi:hypothetical protein